MVVQTWGRRLLAVLAVRRRREATRNKEEERVQVREGVIEWSEWSKWSEWSE